MSLDLKSLSKQKAGFFRFKQLGGDYLITNDIGEYCFLEPSIFPDFLSGRIENTCPAKYRELQEKGFIRDKLDFGALSKKYAFKNRALSRGTSLHIVVVTLRCDHKCKYCQAGSGNLGDKNLDMDISTAQKVVDRAFESPSMDITIEFQGGEPLINLETIKFIIKYASKRNKKAKKSLKFSIVSNLTFMNKNIFEYLLENNIHICASLDGPEKIHNKYRIAPRGKNSYKNTVSWLKNLRKEYKGRNVPLLPSALATITKASFAYPKEIVNEYLNLGLEGIHLRPVSPFGLSSRTGREIGYPPEEFISFYTRALDYIIALNLKNKNFHERFALIFLTKILTDRDPDYLDIRSPCGAGIGQLAYNFNGDIYTCDEARMLGRRQDESFKLGSIKEGTYQEIINGPVVKTMCIASCLDNLAGCSHCLYKPYCGVCPVYNHAVNGNIFVKSPFLCKINSAILDYLFDKLRDKTVKKIFRKWVGA